MKLTKKDLKNLKISVNNNGGFTLWCTETIRTEKGLREVEHWLIDGSMVRKDAEIRLGNPGKLWKVKAVFNKATNSIILKRKGASGRKKHDKRKELNK